MADENPSESEEKKKDDSGKEQLDLFAKKTDQVVNRLDAVSSQVAGLVEAITRAPQQNQQQQAPIPDEQVWQLEEDGRITRAQAMAYLTRKARQEAKEEARRESENVIGQLRDGVRAQSTLKKIAEYTTAYPELQTKGTAEWNKVATRYKQLVEDEGYPNTQVTELAALREIYGNAPGESQVKERTKERARSQETSSSTSTRSAPRGAADRAKDDASDLPAEYRNYVQKMINLRQYSGWDDPKAKKYMSRVRSKLAS